MKLRIMFYALLITVLFVGSANAIANNFTATGNPIDTASGSYVVISGEAIRYSVNSVQMPTYEVIGANSNQVTSEFGISNLLPLPDVSAAPGDVVNHYYYTTIEGNAPTPSKLSILYTTHEGASNWLVEVWSTGSTPVKIATLTPEAIYYGTNTFPDNGDASINIKTTVASTAAQAPSGSYITISYTFEVTASPTGQYTGANYFTYGGLGMMADFVNDLVVTPNITFSRTATVDAPTAYTGGNHDVVPGSIITYTVTFNNTGNGTAENIVIIGKIASNTYLAHVNKTGATDNVIITAPAGVPFGTGWSAYYSSADNPNMFYGNPYGDWSLIGAVNSSADAYPAGTATYRGYTPADAQYLAKWLKFEKSSMQPIAGNRTLTWGVTVR